MLLKHSFYYFVARGIPGIASFFAIALFTRLLDPDQYGRYALVLVASGLAYTVLFSWVPLGLLRFLPAQQEEKQKAALLSAVLSLFWGLSAAVLVGAIGLYLAAPLFTQHPESLRMFFLSGALLLWTRAWYELNLELTRSTLAPKLYGLLSAIKVAISVLLGGWLAYLGFGALGVLFGSAAAFLIPAAAVTRGQWRTARPLAAERTRIGQLALYGVPLTATFALEFIISGSDRLLLAWLKDIETAGLYVVGYDMAKQSLTLLLMIINLAAYPLAVHAFESRGKEAAQQQLSQNFVLLLIVGLPATVGFALLAPNIAGVLVGPAFSSAATEIMPWIAAATFFAGIKAYYVDLSFQLSKNTRLQVFVALFAATANVLLNLWLIPRYGLLGAAYSTLVAYAAALVGGWWLGNRAFALPLPVLESGKVALATLAMALALLPARSLSGAVALSGQVSLGIVAYGAALLLFNVADSRRIAALALGRLKLNLAKTKLFRQAKIYSNGDD